MHSSRMRTGRSLTVCWSLLTGGVWSWGGSHHGGVWSWGIWSQGFWSRGGLVRGGLLLGGGLLPWGSAPRGDISQHALRQTPPVDRHTPVKILPWPNFVAVGKNL